MALAEVREANPADAEQVAAVQLDVWRGAYSRFLPAELLAQLDPATASAAWAQAIAAEGDAQVLVATEGGAVTGFAAGTGAEVAILLVAPRWGRRGHGGRLLGGLAHRLRARGAQRAQVWVPDADDASAAFFPRHGWHPDGAVRTSHYGARVLREIRHSGPTDLHWRTTDTPGEPQS